MIKKKIFIFILLLLTSAIFVVYETWPIVQSEAKIRRKMLRMFPIGTDKEVIWEYAIKVDPGKYGPYKRNTGWRRDYYKDPLVGTSHINASINNIGFIDVSIIWMFDINNKLIDIAIWKTTDLL
tara:strand:- start:559 stop:930 length:372 start_codon:yes stop_codon:yes gene_type:complete